LDYTDPMTTVGLRELRQNASELVRRAEAGEELTITVAGRPAARLVPPALRAWRSYREVAELFRGPADPDWDADRDLIDQQLDGPWAGS
jgi:prevent-host-death family protein